MDYQFRGSFPMPCGKAVKEMRHGMLRTAQCLGLVRHVILATAVNDTFSRRLARMD